MTAPAPEALAGRLGFGCSGLMARLDRRQSLRLLETALDAGITHFDVARSYGYGAAESVVGEFIEKRRDQVTVTTKVGILPPDRSFKMRVAMPVARRAVALLPGLRQVLRRGAAGMVQAGAFDLPTMRASFETSLRELRAQRVDFLLLHDCAIADLARDDILQFLDDARRSGKLGRYGVGTDAATARAAVATASPLADVVQFASSVLRDNVAMVAAPPESLVITHSALASGFAALRAQLARDPALAQAWGTALDIDARDAGQLGRLFVAAALAANPRGVVLFSSTDAARIRLNASAAEDRAADAGRIARLRELAAVWQGAAGAA
jgi:aryl-alcohol dehydrogenase-like predicted oxidoreductase